MAKKKKSKTRLSVIKFIIIGLFVAGFGYVAVNKTVDRFRHADFFKIQSVVIDSSLQFINKRDLRRLMGKNIFTVDLKTTQRRLRKKYPEASKLKIVKRFPNQISISAKQRLPFAQIQIQSRTVTLDEEGIMLFLDEKRDNKLPLIAGVNTGNSKLIRGLPLKGLHIWLALKIIKLFETNESLSSYLIEEINMKNLSKIYLTLSNNLQIIIDRDRIARKIRVLGIVLSQGQLSLKDVKYVDLRFKEPIIGKK